MQEQTLAGHTNWQTDLDSKLGKMVMIIRPALAQSTCSKQWVSSGVFTSSETVKIIRSYRYLHKSLSQNSSAQKYLSHKLNPANTDTRKGWLLASTIYTQRQAIQHSYMCREFSVWYTWGQTFNVYATPVWWVQSTGHMYVVLDVGGITNWWWI